jgi:signal transduction histidine kinase
MELSTIQILTIINSGISLIMGFYMLMLRTSSKNGTGYWAAGSLIIGAGLLLKFIPPSDGFFAIVSPALFICIGLYLYLAGIWEFKKRKIQKWIIIGLPLLNIIQSIVFSLYYPSYRMQGGIYSFIILFYCVYAIYEMFSLNSNQKHLKKIFLLNGISFFIFLAIVLLNITVIITNVNYNPTSLTEIGIILNIISSFVMIALTFGFLSAVNLQLECELKDQLKSKTKFFSIIAHDLRGPIGNIMNFLNLLKTDSELNEKERQEYLDILNTLSQSSYHLLQNLLDWTTKSKNLNRYENERIEINQLIADNMGFFKSSTSLKSINLKHEEGKETFILGNSNMLQTVIRNLFSNAIKFTPTGGNITISSIKKTNMVRVVVSDTGLGIAPETIKYLFKF